MEMERWDSMKYCDRCGKLIEGDHHICTAPKVDYQEIPVKKRVDYGKGILFVVVVVLFFFLLKGCASFFIKKEVKYQMDIDKTVSYTEDGLAYFFIHLKNYDDTGASSFDYKIMIQNEENSNGMFSYIDENGNTSVKDASIMITGTTGKKKEEKTYTVYIYPNGDSSKAVHYKVEYELKAR